MRVDVTVILSLVMIVSTAAAEQVLWDYPMTELPPGWLIYRGEWTFEPDGAHSDAVAAIYEEDWNELWSDELVLPPGTDSVTISAGQYSVTWETALPNTFSFCRMVLTINGINEIYWNVSGGITDSLPISVVPPASAGDTLRVNLLCVAISDPDPPSPSPGLEPQATADFHLWDFSITAHGDIQTLERDTWAGLKRGTAR